MWRIYKPPLLELWPNLNIHKKVKVWLNAYDIDCSSTENGLYSVGKEE